MDDTLYDMIRQTAVSAAKCAGGLQKERFDSNVEIIKETDSDVTTTVDRKCSDIILNQISQVFPSHSILCEEETYREGMSEYEWIVDPLDGSVNYFLGLPYYCVSIACFIKDYDTKIPVIGVVYAPATGELFVGSPRDGVTLNGKRLVNIRQPGLSEGAVGVSLGSSESVFSAVYAVLPALFNGTKKVRSHGATALDLCRVAGGSLSGLYQIGVKIWDFAAGEIILKQAGCKFYARTLGDEGYAIIAGNRSSMSEMEEVFGWKAGVTS